MASQKLGDLKTLSLFGDAAQDRQGFGIPTLIDKAGGAVETGGRAFLLVARSTRAAGQENKGA
ncbi:MAG: hypothetical protein ACJA0Y_002000 [Maricaulis maris]